MRPITGILSVLMLISGCRINRYDGGHMRHGRWVAWFDSSKKVPSSKGRYSHGLETGLWRYYMPDGKLYKRERFNRRQMIIRTLYYHANGRISHKGIAKMVEEGTDLHYFWSGEWKFYAEDGRLCLSNWYDRGKVTRSDTIIRECPPY